MMSVLDPGARILREPIDAPDGWLRGTGGELYRRRPSALLPFAKDRTWSILGAMVRHPFKRGFLADARNKYGVKCSVQRCASCGRNTWWTPAFKKAEREFNPDCLADECPSYDPHRDVSFLFGDGE